MKIIYIIRPYMDEHHWMTSYGCLLVVGCNVSSQMRERLLASLHIFSSFVNSEKVLWELFKVFNVNANFHHLENLANVDAWLLKVGQHAHVRRCAPHVSPSQASSNLLPIFCLLVYWYGFKFLLWFLTIFVEHGQCRGKEWWQHEAVIWVIAIVTRGTRF